jgi:hypothetical protein
LKKILKPLLFLIIIFALIGVVYFVFKRNSTQQTATNNPAPTVTEPGTPTPELNVDKVLRVTDPAGKYSAFSLTYNNSWTVAADSHSLNKGDYRISFSAVQGTDAECIFSGNYNGGQSQLDARNLQYNELSNAFGKFRYFETGHDNTLHFFEFCGTGLGKSDSKFYILTKIGVLSYTVPLNPSPTIVAEMDKMIKSIAP